jgi:hypothetical protein
MKIGVLIPSHEYKGHAGARIRYGRISPSLTAEGHDLVLEDIAVFDFATADHDVLLISKCHDARSLLIAEAFGQRGRLVGIDLFDDYFSQTQDARLTRYRSWLAQVSATADFALCSTEAMASVARQFRADLPTHVMNDPSSDFRIEALAETLKRRCWEAQDTRQVRLCWFGIGDNPHFPVGLTDLHAFGIELGRIVRAGYDVELTVLTNTRALDAGRLELLRQLPLRTRIEEWSEAGEAEQLGRSLATFIPVNAQVFSVAKSLNRAVTALNAGCQVISSGFPLYAALDRLVYRDSAQLLADLELGSLKLSAESLLEYAALMEQFASPVVEANGLAQFLAGLAPRAVTRQTLVLIHGVATSGEAHKRIQALGGLSVGSPLCAAKLGFDVVFEGELAGNGLAMLVTDAARNRLNASAYASAVPHGRVAGRQFWKVASEHPRQALDTNWTEAPLPLQFAVYRNCMEQIAHQVADAFGPCRMIFSETSPLPFAPPIVHNHSQAVRYVD